MKKAFSMIELIFVIVLLGIMAKIGVSFIPDNKLLSDTHYIAMKIKEAQKNAIGYDDFNFSDPKLWDMTRSDYNRACITCNKDFFQNLDHNTSLYVDITCSETSFCFDSYGRPYYSGVLLVGNIDIKVSYNGQDKNISVLPMSGYVIIK